MLKVNLFRTPAIRQLVEHNFDDLRVRAGDPRDTAFIDLNMCSFNARHEFFPLANLKHNVSRLLDQSDGAQGRPSAQPLPQYSGCRRDNAWIRMLGALRLRELNESRLRAWNSAAGTFSPISGLRTPTSEC